MLLIYLQVSVPYLMQAEAGKELPAASLYPETIKGI